MQQGGGGGGGGRRRRRRRSEGSMRREGVLTGYIGNKDSSSFSAKVKVKGKPTNASKASGRCGCPKCHQHPVSEAKSKSKGRNKRAWSRCLVDDEWAFRESSPASHITLLSHVDDDNDALDACHADANSSDYADVTDVCHTDVNVNDIKAALDVAAAAPHANPAKTDDVVDDDNDAYNAHDVCHAEANLPNVSETVHDDCDIKGAHDVSAVRTVDSPHSMMHTQLVFALDSHICMVACPIPVAVMNPQICTKVNGVVVVDDGDANHRCHAMMMAHAEDDDADDGYANRPQHHGVMIRAADVASDNDDEDDLQSLLSGLVNVEWPPHDNNVEVSDVESDGNSLSGDWCHVASSDAIVDDWYLC